MDERVSPDCPAGDHWSAARTRSGGAWWCPRRPGRGDSTWRAPPCRAGGGTGHEKARPTRSGARRRPTAWSRWSRATGPVAVDRRTGVPGHRRPGRPILGTGRRPPWPDLLRRVPASPANRRSRCPVAGRSPSPRPSPVPGRASDVGWPKERQGRAGGGTPWPPPCRSRPTASRGNRVDRPAPRPRAGLRFPSRVPPSVPPWGTARGTSAPLGERRGGETPPAVPGRHVPRPDAPARPRAGRAGFYRQVLKGRRGRGRAESSTRRSAGRHRARRIDN